MLEEPLIGTVSYPIYIFVLRAREVGPAFINNSMGTSRVNSVQDNANHSLRIV
jgi:hypothetical protein